MRHHRLTLSRITEVTPLISNSEWTIQPGRRVRGSPFLVSLAAELRNEPIGLRRHSGERRIPGMPRRWRCAASPIAKLGKSGVTAPERGISCVRPAPPTRTSSLPCAHTLPMPRRCRAVRQAYADRSACARRGGRRGDPVPRLRDAELLRGGDHSHAGPQHDGRRQPPRSRADPVGVGSIVRLVLCSSGRIVVGMSFALPQWGAREGSRCTTF